MHNRKSTEKEGKGIKNVIINFNAALLQHNKKNQKSDNIVMDAARFSSN